LGGRSSWLLVLLASPAGRSVVVTPVLALALLPLLSVSASSSAATHSSVAATHSRALGVGGGGAWCGWVWRKWVGAKAVARQQRDQARTRPGEAVVTAATHGLLCCCATMPQH
jgi:hypothetical protein